MTYSTSTALVRQRFSIKRNQNITSFRAKERTIGPISNTIILVVLACILGLVYLAQVTKTNAFGYKIHELQTQAAQLQQEHDELEVASARLQALDRIKTSDAAKSLVVVAPAETLQN